MMKIPNFLKNIEHHAVNNDNIILDVFDNSVLINKFSINDKITQMALAMKDYTIAHSDDGAQSYKQGKVSMFKLNKNVISGSSEFEYLNGVSLRNELSLTDGFFDSTNNEDFTYIKKLPDIKNADIKCDKLSYAHIGSDIALVDNYNPDEVGSEKDEVFLVVGIPGEKNVSLNVNDNVSNLYHGTIMIYEKELTVDNQVGEYFNEVYTIPSLPLYSKANGDVKAFEFGNKFNVTNDLSKIYTFNHDVNIEDLNTFAIKEISFDEKMAIKGSNAYYNSRNHFFKNTVQFDGDINQISGKARFGELEANKFALDIFETTLLYVGRAKQSFLESLNRFEISVSTSIFDAEIEEINRVKNTSLADNKQVVMSVSDLHNANLKKELLLTYLIIKSMV